MPTIEPIAILSDIHGNLEAAQAVIADIRAQGIRRTINLGDTVGYGPDPEACIDLVQVACTLNLCGNHDYAVLHDAEGFNPIARAAVDFVRERLQPKPDSPHHADMLRRWQFLENLETLFEEGEIEAMHASPRQPITEYVLPSDPEMDPQKVRDIFAAMSHRAAFIGHTHFPGIIEEGQDFFLMPQMFQWVYRLGSARALVNVGSVGQPRDRDTRCCYISYDGEVVRYRRVEYDIEKTVRKVRESQGLHEICGLRLREGR
jgi:diadenosine tetraphosphatase ApaH/serine/threonine PP2A family protein phosphatase